MGENYILTLDGKNPYFEEMHRIDFRLYEIIDNIKDRDLTSNDYEDMEFRKLTESIRKNSILTPLIFKRINDKKLELVSGRRRLKALKIINRDNDARHQIEKIPVRIIKQDAPMSFVYRVAFSENELRKDLPPYVRAESIMMVLLANFTEENNEELNIWDYLQRQRLIQALRFDIYPNIKAGKNIGDAEAILGSAIKKTSEDLNIPTSEIAKIIEKDALSIDEKRYIVKFGLDFKELKKIMSNHDLKNKIEYIDSLEKHSELANKKDCEHIYDCVKKLGKKMSDFYLEVKDIDNLINLPENEIEEKYKYRNNAGKDQYMNGYNMLVDYLLSEIRNIIDSSEEAKKIVKKRISERKKELNTSFFSLNEKQQEEVLAYIRNLKG